MKAHAVVLGAVLLATATPAFGHGGNGGSPVMAPVGRPVMSTPIAFPDRRYRERPLRFRANTYADRCQGTIYAPALYPQYQGKGGPPCSIQTQNGLLPPAFLW